MHQESDGRMEEDVPGHAADLRGAASYSPRSDAEEICTKNFHARFRRKAKMTSIHELHPKTGAHPAQSGKKDK